MLQEFEKDLLRNYITKSEPFGPMNASEIAEPEARKILFDVHNNLYKSLPQRPSVVIGRKGSGKTAYLQSAYFDKVYDFVVEVDTDKALIAVIDTVEKLSKGTIFAETVATLWETILWIPMFSQIRTGLSSKTKSIVDDYMAKIGIRTGGTVDDVLWNIVDALAEGQKNNAIGIISDVLRRTDTVTFHEVKTSVCEELHSRKKRAILLVDSLEDFHLDIDSVAIAVRGLLKCIGRANTPTSSTDIRFCIPAEQYYQFAATSSNHNKDFRRELLLHWITPELLAVAASRLLIYFELYDSALFDQHGSYTDLDRRNIPRLFHSIMPEKITNRLGITEEPLAYICRHTQLLPRHLIIILNSICGIQKRYGSSSDFFFSVESIRQGITTAEEKIVLEIFNAYSATYPLAQKACSECLPELQHKFTIGDLERVFRTHGKKAMGTNEFDDFKRMLTEIGAIGRVVGETEKYINAVFEYTAHHRLVTSTDDELCLHPLFTEVFSAKTRLKKSVYPYGSSIDDKDYREPHE
jgi:hypothetical protein